MTDETNNDDNYGDDPDHSPLPTIKPPPSGDLSGNGILIVVGVTFLFLCFVVLSGIWFYRTHKRRKQQQEHDALERIGQAFEQRDETAEISSTRTTLPSIYIEAESDGTIVRLDPANPQVQAAVDVLDMNPQSPRLLAVLSVLSHPSSTTATGPAEQTTTPATQDDETAIPGHVPTRPAPHP